MARTKIDWSDLQRELTDEELQMAKQAGMTATEYKAWGSFGNQPEVDAYLAADEASAEDERQAAVIAQALKQAGEIL